MSQVLKDEATLTQSIHIQVSISVIIIGYDLFLFLLQLPKKGWGVGGSITKETKLIFKMM